MTTAADAAARDLGALTGAGRDRGCPSGLEPAAPVDDVADPAPFVRTEGAPGATVSVLELLVRGAKCGGCIAKIEGGLGAVSGVTEARLNLSTGKLRVAFTPGAVRPIEIARKLQSLGYQSAPFDPAAARADEDAEGKRLLRALAVAGFASANIMLLSVSVWAGHEGEMSAATRDLFHWLSALIALPTVAYAGRPFFGSAWAALSKGRANMDVPISLGVLLATGLSLYETSTSGHHAYFDAAVMLLFFLLIGRWLDHRLRGRARAAARELLALQARTASRIEADGRVTAVATRDVRPGDRLVLAAGDRAPVDVTIESGVSDVDRSLATGESAPAAVAAGDMLQSGVVNLSGRLIVRALAKAEDSFLAELGRLIEAGEQARTPLVRLADHAARLYVPLVHAAAALTFAGWMLAGAGVYQSLTIAISLLIITCPCALGLAVPAVQVVATGRLFKRGILVKTGDALERLARATRVVFDKTGTLTLGAPTLVNAGAIGPERLAFAAQLARGSRHPLARAVVAAAGPGPVATDMTESPGLGLEGEVGGVRVRLGRGDWAGAPTDAAPPPGPATWLGIDRAPPVRLEFADTLRPDTADTVAALANRGLAAELLSGDARGPVAAVAAAAGLTVFAAEADPADKAKRLSALETAGERVLMVGDGLNDAPALARAFVSISPGTAAEASQHASDLVFQGDSLRAVVEAVDVARAARRRILENFALAIVYNLIAVPIAAAGFVTPLIAALAMSGSSILVTLNALRLAKGAAR